MTYYSGYSIQQFWMWLNKVFRPETRPAARIAWQRRKLQDVRRTRSGCRCWLINGSLGGDLYTYPHNPTYTIKEYQGISRIYDIYEYFIYSISLFCMCVYNCIFRIYTKTFISICMHIRNLNLKTSEVNLYASVSYTASLTRLYPNRVQPTETCSTSPHNLRWHFAIRIVLGQSWPQEAQKRHQELERRKTEIKQLEVAGRFDVNFWEGKIYAACLYIYIDT